VQSKEPQPRDGETNRKANNGLRQVDDDGDADGSAHLSLQSGPMAIYKPRKIVVTRIRQGDQSRWVT
jgi:hypothetical protein